MNLQAFPHLQHQKQLLLIDSAVELAQEATPPMTSVSPLASSLSTPLVARAIENLFEIDAESILQEELHRYNKTMIKAGNFKVGWVVADENRSGGRETFELARLMETPDDLKKGWLTIIWWSQDEVTPEKLRISIAEQIFKSLKVHEGKFVRTLSELVNLEAQVIRFSKNKSAERKRQLWFSDFAKYMLTADVATILACFHGDDAARRLGLRALGFPNQAGRIYANWMA